MCLSTNQFADVIMELLNRIFEIIKILSMDISDANVITNGKNTEDDTLELGLASIVMHIAKQCSDKIALVSVSIRISMYDWWISSIFR